MALFFHNHLFLYHVRFLFISFEGDKISFSIFLIVMALTIELGVV